MSVNIFKQNESYKICKNIKHYCDFRGITINNYKKITLDEITDLVKYELNCVLAEKPLCIVFVPTGSKYNKPAELNNLLATKGDSDVIIVKSVKAKKTNMKKITSKGNVQILDGIYFLVNYKKYLEQLSYVIRITSQDEIANIMNLYRIPSKKCFSPIINTMIEVIWLGAKLDDIIYLEYPTIASCEVSANYRIIARQVPIFDEDEEV